jgi:hypothetical protein
LIEANRVRAQKSPGPKSTALTARNATTHGLSAKGISELDEEFGYEELLADLNAEYAPQGRTETFLLERVALYMVRMKRAGALEAEFINAELHPEVREEPAIVAMIDGARGAVLDPGWPARLRAESVERLGVSFQRYEQMLECRLFKTLHELERCQRMRKGEKIPAPAAGDLVVHPAG